MATKIKSSYLGDGLVEITHGPTGKKIITDLPPDNGGKGREFSPTDLAAASISSCILTIMGVIAKRENADIKGSFIEIEKHMSENPRRIGKFTGVISLPKDLNAKTKEKIMAAIKACPVTRSLNPEIKIDFKEI
ncbi:MAG: OsmC family protein [Elusimicrobiota bacterium]